jgi:hypothetical protein
MAHPAAALTMLVAKSIGHSDFGFVVGGAGCSSPKPMTGWPLKWITIAPKRAA